MEGKKIAEGGKKLAPKFLNLPVVGKVWKIPEWRGVAAAVGYVAA